MSAPFINAAGTFTTMTASLMPPEVMEAMVAASKQFVPLIELQDKVGRAHRRDAWLPSLRWSPREPPPRSPAARPAASPERDQKAISQLPDLTGLKSEVLIQKSHRYGYDHAVRAAGIRMVEIETAEELERAVNANTAMMLFFNDADPKGQIKARRVGRAGQEAQNSDLRTTLPPMCLRSTNLTKFTKMGFDLVTFSGGKGIRGPQSAGILAGRKDLIQAARLNTSPYSDSISPWHEGQQRRNGGDARPRSNCM